MVPSFIRALMTSAAFTDMRWASSPTVMVSGTATSRTSGSVGAAKAVCSPLELPRCLPPPRACQPPTPPPASPRVLMVRRRAESSRSTVVGFAFFGFLSVFASPVAGLGACSVVAGAAGGPGGGGRRGGGSRLDRLLLFGGLLLGLALLALVPLAQLRRLQLGELLLASCLFFSELLFLRIDGGRGRRGRRCLGRDRRGGDLRRVALDEHALLAHLDLNRAVLAGGVGLLDLARLPAGQRDLVLRLDRAVRLAQVLEEARLVLLRERVVGQALVDAGRAQLLEQHGGRNLKLARELGYARLRHRYADSLSVNQ